MKTTKGHREIAHRKKLLDEIANLADVAIFGTPSETYRTCGHPTCRCKGPGPKHGPHLNVSFRGANGKTSGYYVPAAAQQDIRRGVEAWKIIQDHLKVLADENRRTIFERAKAARAR